MATELVTMQTTRAEAGQSCSWCDCEVPRPAQLPGGAHLFAGHDEASCAGCNRLAVLVVEMTVPLLELVARMPVCGKHHAEAVADLTQDFGVGR